MSNNEITDIVLNTLKANSKDSRISRRLVLSTLESKAKYYISQKLNDKSLYREANIYKEIPCVPFISVDIIKCPIIEFRTCKTLMRSKTEVPELIWSKYGHTLKEVTSVDGSFTFEPITATQYRKNKQRTGKSNKKYFYVKDNFVYIPDYEFYMGNLYLISQDGYELSQISECSENRCDSVWEFEFICPNKLEEIVIQDTIKQLSLTKQIQEDVNPNLNSNG
jgi:hypothetical protein|nr:MAG TPA: Structural protein [Caudoviricetes sp.]